MPSELSGRRIMNRIFGKKVDLETGEIEDLAAAETATEPAPSKKE